MSDNQNTLGQIKTLAQRGVPVTASEHPTFQTLSEIEPIQPDLPVAMRLSKESTLGSGALRVVTFEHVNDSGLEVLQRYDGSIIARIAVRLSVERPFELKGRTVQNQFTLLSFEFDENGGHDISPEASIPFDEQMREDTYNEWLRWGVKLKYELTQEGGSFGVEPLDDDLKSVLGMLAQGAAN